MLLSNRAVMCYPVRTRTGQVEKVDLNLERFLAFDKTNVGTQLRFGFALYVASLCESPLGLRSAKALRSYVDKTIDSIKTKDDALTFFDRMHKAATTVLSSLTKVPDYARIESAVKDYPIYREAKELTFTYSGWESSMHARLVAGDLIAYILQVLLVTKKMALSIDYKRKTFDGWMKIQSEKYSGTKYDKAIAALVVEMIGSHPRDFSGDTRSYFRPSHGPGAIRDRSKPTSDAKTEFVFQDIESMEGAVNEWRKDLHYLARALDMDEDCFGDLRLNHVLSSVKMDGGKGTPTKISEQEVVPKGLLDGRLIGVEDVVLVYGATGVRRSIEDILEITSPHIKLEDQTLNQELAFLGSIGMGWSTTDYSRASDKITIDHARAWLSPSWFKILNTVRAQTILTMDGEVEPYTFLGMGSPVCFVVECIFFAAVAALSIALSNVADEDRILRILASKTNIGSKIRRSALKRCRVYGDDVVVPDTAFDKLLQLSGAFQFQVNVAKSFGPLSAFRESCGFWFWNGIDVTPVQSRYIESHELSVRNVPSFVATVNQFFHSKRYVLRELILRRLYFETIVDLDMSPYLRESLANEDTYGDVLLSGWVAARRLTHANKNPFLTTVYHGSQPEDRSDIIYTDSPQDDKTPSRWSGDYMCKYGWDHDFVKPTPYNCDHVSPAYIGDDPFCREEAIHDVEYFVIAIREKTQKSQSDTYNYDNFLYRKGGGEESREVRIATRNLRVTGFAWLAKPT